VNTLVRTVLTLVYIDLRKWSIETRLNLTEQLPSINGNEIKPGDKIKVGSRVDLVIASGRGEDQIEIPKLIGLQLADVRVLVEQLGLTIGALVKNPDVIDIENAYIYRQEPMPGKGRIRPGQMIDVWLSVERPILDSMQTEQPIQFPEP